MNSKGAKGSLIGIGLGLALYGVYKLWTTASTKNNMNESVRTTPSIRLSLKFGRYPRLLSISGMGILFKRTASGELELIPTHLEQIETLLLHCRHCYIITTVKSDDDEAKVALLLEKSGLFSKNLDPLRILFCSTKLGRRHIARQLGVAMHFDTDLQLGVEMSPNIEEVVILRDHESVNDHSSSSSHYSSPNSSSSSSSSSSASSTSSSMLPIPTPSSSRSFTSDIVFDDVSASGFSYPISLPNEHNVFLVSHLRECFPLELNAAWKQ